MNNNFNKGKDAKRELKICFCVCMLNSRLVAAVVKTADYKAYLYINGGEFLSY